MKTPVSSTTCNTAAVGSWNVLLEQLANYIKPQIIWLVLYCHSVSINLQRKLDDFIWRFTGTWFSLFCLVFLFGLRFAFVFLVWHESALMPGHAMRLIPWILVHCMAWHLTWAASSPRPCTIDAPTVSSTHSQHYNLWQFRLPYSATEVLHLTSLGRQNKPPVRDRRERSS